MTDNPSGPPRLLSSLRSADGKGIVHIEDRFDTNIDDCGPPSLIQRNSPTGWESSRATCDSEEGSARGSSPANEKALAASKSATRCDICLS
jgi:hypothetical protein